MPHVAAAQPPLIWAKLATAAPDARPHARTRRPSTALGSGSATDWLASAIDAITGEGYAGVDDWSIAHTLHRLEGYNGYGYYTRNINSPCLWSFSNHYSKGKYVRDRVFDPNKVSK